MEKHTVKNQDLADIIESLLNAHSDCTSNENIYDEVTGRVYSTRSIKMLILALREGTTQEVRIPAYINVEDLENMLRLLS